MTSISFDFSRVEKLVGIDKVNSYEKQILEIVERFENDESLKNYLGWKNLPNDYNKEEFNRILQVSKKVRKKFDAMVVIGIGGSYLGARAVIEALGEDSGIEIFFAGNNMSSDYISKIISKLSKKDFCINVISKSGTTTEPAIAFRVFKNILEEKFSKSEVCERIFATTDRDKGVLKTLANEEGYECFVVPDDVGGRYSVLTAVGLLPIAVAGLDVEKLMKGARDAVVDCSKGFGENDAFRYAVLRNVLYSDFDKRVEMVVGFRERMRFFSEWWKQLFGESEGKDEKGIFPSSACFTTDLHSLGQFIQEGSHLLCETFINVDKSSSQILISKDEKNLDNLNYLAGKDLDFVNNKAFIATLDAHSQRGVPCFVVNVSELSEENLGYLIYFFEFACAVSGMILEVNPFDQPGVEVYKKRMFELLGKPGY